MVSSPAARAALWFRDLWLVLVVAAAMPLGCLPPEGRPARSSGGFDGGIPDGTGVDGFYVDRDRDGVSPAEGDCNDDNPMVYPGAPELCDGLDHDCNNLRGRYLRRGRRRLRDPAREWQAGRGLQ